jgi:hypothetical protein
MLVRSFIIFYLPDIVRVIISRKMKLVGHIALMGKTGIS